MNTNFLSVGYQGLDWLIQTFSHGGWHTLAGFVLIILSVLGLKKAEEMFYVWWKKLK